MTLEKTAIDTATTAAQVTETALRKAWSLMDAATEKQPPSEALSPKAIQAIQGLAGDGA